MLDVLVFLLILLVIVALVSAIVGSIPMPANLRNALWIVILVIALIVLLQRLGVLGGV